MQGLSLGRRWPLQFYEVYEPSSLKERIINTHRVCVLLIQLTLRFLSFIILLSKLGTRSVHGTY